MAEWALPVNDNTSRSPADHETERCGKYRDATSNTEFAIQSTVNILARINDTRLASFFIGAITLQQTRPVPGDAA